MAPYRRRHEDDAGTASELICGVIGSPDGVARTSARRRAQMRSRSDDRRREIRARNCYRSGIGGRTTGWPSSAMAGGGGAGGSGAAAGGKGGT